jgi:hypothetical protein
MDKKISNGYRGVVKWLERILALAVLFGVLVSAGQGAVFLARADWSSTDAFYELIYRALLLVIGLELVRMLITHSLGAVLELLAFVIARKMLKPDLSALDVALVVAAFVALLAGRKHLLSRSCYQEGEDPGEEGGPGKRPRPG